VSYTCPVGDRALTGRDEWRKRDVTAARTLREIRRQGLIYAGLAPFVVIALFPICWMVITAFKQDADPYRSPCRSISTPSPTRPRGARRW
jgi:ABC-type glycerol-3-phosphate transport system permease component